MKRLFILLHRYLGLACTLLAITIGLSGSLLIFKQQLQHRSNDELHSKLGSFSGYQALYSSIKARYPRSAINLYPTKDIHEAVQARIRDRLQGEHYVWLDPVTAHILKDQKPEDDLFAWLHNIHSKLLLPQGRIWVGLLGILIVLLLISGIVFWWPRNWSTAWRIRSNKGIYVLIKDLHRLVGASMLLLLLISAVSGTLLAFNQPIKNWLTPAQHNKSAAKQIAVADGPRLPLDELIRRANIAQPQGELSRINISDAEYKAVELRKRLPQDIHPNGSTLITIDPYHGNVLRIEQTETSNPWRLISSWALIIHNGSAGGWLLKLTMFLGGWILALLGASGVLQWLQRQRKLR